jgi:ABC-type transport system involved in multi-copper enzyme maturation permease subunit
MSGNAIRSIFSFFFFIGRKSRKTRIFFLISALPVLAAVIIQIKRLFSPGAGVEGLAVFSNIIMAFYVQFLILVLALFYGTSVCSEEIEGKTLTYLTTRPVAKPSIILGKYAAYVLFLIAMVTTGVVLSFMILNMEQLLRFSVWLILGRSLGVLVLGLVCYTAFFTLVGTFLKKSVLFGLFFCFGWESIVQYFPGSTQKFTIMHYLKSLLPAASSGGASGPLSFLFIRLEPSSPAAAVVTLAILTAVFLGAAGFVFSRKEYIFVD